jgi:hypothetical protein
MIFQSPDKVDLTLHVPLFTDAEEVSWRQRYAFESLSAAELSPNQSAHLAMQQTCVSSGTFQSSS